MQRGWLIAFMMLISCCSAVGSKFGWSRISDFTATFWVGLSFLWPRRHTAKAPLRKPRTHTHTHTHTHARTHTHTHTHTYKRPALFCCCVPSSSMTFRLWTCTGAQLQAGKRTLLLEQSRWQGLHRGRSGQGGLGGRAGGRANAHACAHARAHTTALCALARVRFAVSPMFRTVFRPLGRSARQGGRRDARGG